MRSTIERRAIRGGCWDRGYVRHERNNKNDGQPNEKDCEVIFEIPEKHVNLNQVLFKEVLKKSNRIDQEC